MSESLKPNWGIESIVDFANSESEMTQAIFEEIKGKENEQHVRAIGELFALATDEVSKVMETSSEDINNLEQAA